MRERLQSLLSKESGPYFQKDEQGRDIYYPWGNTGDCYYLKQGNQTMLKVLSNASKLITALIVIILIFLMSYVFLFNIVMIAPIIFIFTWFVFLYFYQRTLVATEGKNVSNPKFQKTPHVIKEIFGLGLVQACAFFFVFKVGYPFPFLPQTALFVSFLHFLAIWFIWHRRGYIFQKKPASMRKH